MSTAAIAQSAAGRIPRGGPCHAVQFYERDEVLLDAVAEFVGEALECGASALVIATPAHAEEVARRLEGRSALLPAARAAGRYVEVDEASMLRAILGEADRIDAARFAAVIEPLVAAAAAASGDCPAVFGEMVASLWRQGRHQEALQLEELWNDLRGRHDFRLLCAYPMPVVARGPGDGARDICAAHSHSVPAESFTSLVSGKQQLDAICGLQQRAEALEQEIRARTDATSRLAQRERELRDLFDNAPLAIHSVGPDGEILWANRAELEMLGYARDEYVGCNIAEFYVDRHAAAQVLDRLRQKETLHDLPAEMRCKDGTTRHLRVTSNVSWADDAFVRTRCFSRDVTEQWRAEQALQHTRDDAARTQALLSAIVESSSDAIICRSLDGTILSWNQGATEHFGYPAEEAIGQSIGLIIPPDRAAEERQMLARLERGERIDHFETVRVAKDGRSLFVSLSISPVRDASGAIVGASSVARDISERKRLEEREREADRRKDEFIAMLGHELRNPLAPIRNGAELLRRSLDGDHASVRVCEMLERQIGQMTRLLDDLLDVSRISRGEINFRREAVDLRTVASRAVEASRPSIEARRHALQVQLPEQDLALEGDEARLVQMITNLLNNAAKYTSPGGHLALRVEGQGEEVVITVRDDGCGIDPAALPRIFDLFVRGGQSQGQVQDGLGVGLTLVRHIAERHGGTVSVRGNPTGRGSEFVVTLPRRSEARAPRRDAGVPPLQTRPRRIVIVDDNRDAALSLASLLRLGGHNVREAHDAVKGLDLVLAEHPDVVLLDIGLPNVDGLEVARRLRTRGCKSTLIAVTGYGTAVDHERSRDAGIDHHLVKPVDFAALDRLLAASSPAPSTRAPQFG